MIFSPLIAIPLFFVMLLLLEAGRRFKAQPGWSQAPQSKTPTLPCLDFF